MKTLDLLLREEFAEVLSEADCTAVIDSDGDTTFVNRRNTRAATITNGPGFIAAVCYTVNRGWFKRQFSFSNRGFVLRPAELRAWLADQPVDLVQPGSTPFETVNILLERGRHVLMEYLDKPAIRATSGTHERGRAASAPQAQLLTYSDDPEVGIFCQLLLHSEERILVSVAHDSIAVFELDETGSLPTGTIWSSSDFGAVINLISCRKFGLPDILARMKELLESCDSIASVSERLAASA